MTGLATPECTIYTKIFFNLSLVLLESMKVSLGSWVLSVYIELCGTWKTFVRTGFLSKTVLTNLEASVEQRKSILCNGVL